MDWSRKSLRSEEKISKNAGYCKIFTFFLAYCEGFINLYSEIEKAYNEVAFELMKKYDFHLSSFSRKFEIINAYIVMFYENS